MGVFQFLQNEIQGAGNAIQNGASSAYNSVSNFVKGGAQNFTGHAQQNVIRPVSRLGSAIAQSIVPAAQDTYDFGKAIASPIQGAANTLRSIPSLAYGALGSITPGHTFKGNIQQYNNTIPSASFSNSGFSGLENKGLVSPTAGNMLNQGGQIAGGMTVPLPGIGEVKTLEGLSPLAKLGGYTALRSGEGAAVGGLNALSQNGDIHQAVQGAKTGALIGAAGNILLSPRLVGDSMNQVHNMEPVRGSVKIREGATPGEENQPITKTEAKLTAKNLQPTIQPPQGPKDLGLVKTIQESPQTTDALKTGIEGGYTKISNPEAMAAATQRIATDPSAAYHFATMTHSAEGNATAVLLAKHFEENGQSDLAANLMVTKAKQALQAGQGNQIYSMWDKLSPETVAQTAAKTIEDYNATAKTKLPSLSTDQYQEFVNQAKTIQGMPEGRDKGMATQKLLESIGKLVPSSGGDKTFALYRTGLLTGFRTPGKILLSHGVSNLAEGIKNIPASIADMGMSALTGQRSLVATPKGMLEGGTKGFSAAVDNLVHGYETSGSGGMVHDFTQKVNFGDSTAGKVAQTYVDTVARLHGSLYKPFYGAQHLNSLYDMALTNAKNQGLAGAEKESFVQDFVKKAAQFSVDHPLADPHAPINTPESAAMRANAEAQYTTFQNKTKLGSIAGGMKQGTGNPTRYIVPFTQIPSSIAMKLLDYSPIGAVKEAIQQIAAGKLDQRALSQAIGRSVTGTGVMFLGKALFDRGQITGAYPTDPKTQAEWQLEGKQANSILLGGKWHQLASFGPAGDAISVGAAFAQGMQGSPKTAGNLFNASLGAGVQGIRTIADSPYLQGINNISQAINDPVKNSLKVVEGLTSSIIPTGIANIASATDPLQRQTNNLADAITNKIPGLRETNLPQTNVLGQPVARGNSVGGSLFDPTYASQDTSTPFTNNLDALAKTGNDATPTYSSANAGKVDKTISALGVSYSVTPQQATQLQTTVGQQVQTAMQALMKQPEYQAMNNADKQAALAKIESTVKDRVYQGFVSHNNLPIPMGTKLSASAQGTMSLVSAMRSGNASTIQQTIQSIPFANRTTAYNDAIKLVGQSQLSPSDQLTQDLKGALGESTAAPSSATLKSSSGKISGASKLLVGSRKASGGGGRIRIKTGGSHAVPKLYKGIKPLTQHNAGGTIKSINLTSTRTHSSTGSRGAMRTRLPRYKA